MDIVTVQRLWRTRIASVLIALAPLFGFWKYYATSMAAEMQASRSRLSELQSSTAQAAANAGRLQRLRDVVSRLERDVASFDSITPSRTDLAGVLQSVETMAARFRLTVRRFAPQPTKTQSSYAEVSYKFQVDGRFQDLAAFLHTVGVGTPAIGVRDLTISAKAQQPGEGLLRAECVLFTIVMTDSNQPLLAHARRTNEPSRPQREPSHRGGSGRDPFAVPARSIAVDSRAQRPTGLQGLLVDEIAVKGIIRDSAGFTALVQGPDRRTFIARAGERLRDAVVKAVTADAIVFSRTADERVRGKGQQDVVRPLRSGDGGRR